ncbi:thiamine-phosphate kinase [Synechococcus sp. CCY9201]|uniref:thiamine-phosphate kinase n=1 Tax=unclassified Synechococcus TaxID=2626047 RepID=UPI002AD29B92|nr:MULTISPECIES: thiamine-phosphate kinase [unclassified Synechococcus]MEA5423477.1 thiamine-phosphate kinase [Synechococcus sp. CCY9202]MEA5475796.1 thiamine-phosphate kinase [Synechococcus sp. CCY9201]CAK6687002.1 Thiamine-monophosphate kinase [Synechococcus sp. CBW1107]
MAEPAPPASAGDRGSLASPTTLSDLGEWELIRRLGAFAPTDQFSDDAALVPGGSGSIVINTDVLVEGLHFSEATTGAADVGWRAAVANLSDLAAMGCQEVVGLTVGLVAPPTTAWAWVEEVYQGLSAALRRYGGTLLGGDCSAGNQRLLAITALGRLAAASQQTAAAQGRTHGMIRRGGGRAGDLLVSTGHHGLSRLGLALLQGDSGLDVAAIDPSLRQRAIEAHRRPRPRFDAVEALHRSQPAGEPWRVGGTDSSDGLVAAAQAIGAASGCDVLLQSTTLPMDPAMGLLPQGRRWCLGGGEDFELVLALPRAWAQALAEELEEGQLIGALVAGSGVVRWAENREPLAADNAGFSHFRAASTD